MSSNPLWSNTPQLYHSMVESVASELPATDSTSETDVKPGHLPEHGAGYKPLGIAIAIAAMSLSAAGLNFAAECVKWKNLLEKTKEL